VLYIYIYRGGATRGSHSFELEGAVIYSAEWVVRACVYVRGRERLGIQLSSWVVSSIQLSGCCVCLYMYEVEKH